MKILVIGSGATGVHFALSALRKNHSVTMLDVGTQRPTIPLPEENFVGLKQRLENPVGYFLGEGFEGAVLPRSHSPSEYYNLPAEKNYVFKAPKFFQYSSDGLSPLVSFAGGGLAEAWTGGCYPLNDEELRDFPFGREEIRPYYGEVARRIGIGGEEDDLARFFPPHQQLSAPVGLDENSANLLARYERQRDVLRTRHRIRLGRSRQAVLSKARDGRDGCRQCGRCLWGCPNGALYTPALTLRECNNYKNFTYRPGFFASHFQLGSGLVDHLVAYSLEGGAKERFRADAYVVACGTLSTSNLVLRSVYKSTGEIIRLTGLMDNRQVLAPFFNLAMWGRPYNPDSYQYHQLAIGMISEQSGKYVHGQITPLKTATVHSIIQSLPMNLRSAISVFSALRSGLGVLNLNFSDCRREENYATLEHDLRGEEFPRLYIHYAPAPDEATMITNALKKVRPFFFDLLAPILPGLTRLRPMGRSVHYSGTMPMARDKRPWCLSPDCQSYDVQNMFVIDGAGMPFLPAKNLTFTLMANAIRVAERVF